MKRSKTLNEINEILQYIEKNIKKRITLDDISSSFKLSKFHIHRLFKAVTNKKLMEYIRNRKLTHSIKELIDTELKIIDIAYEYNFTHEQSFIRAFKNEFGISPNRFRKEKTEIQITDMLDINYLKPIGDAGFAAHPSIRVKPSFWVVGINHKIYFKDNVEQQMANKVSVDFYYNHRMQIQDAKNKNVFLGIVKFSDNFEDYKYYMPSIEVCSYDSIPAGMISLNIPTSKYAVFKYVFFKHAAMLSILDFYDIQKDVNNWLVNSNYAMTNGFSIERVDFDMSRDDYSEFELYIPIISKSCTSANNCLFVPDQKEYRTKAATNSI